MENIWSESDDDDIRCEAAENVCLTFDYETAERTDLLNSDNDLFKKTIVKFGGELTEYLTIGIDPVSFKPMLRICNNDGISVTFVSCSLCYFGDLTSYLEEQIDNGIWSRDCIYRCEVYVESKSTNIYYLKSKFGENVSISIDAVKQIAGSYREMYEVCKKYDDEYRKYKNTIENHQLQMYRQYFPENFNVVKNCTELSNYFGLKSKN